jgi:hypothetical protein
MDTTIFLFTFLFIIFSILGSGVLYSRLVHLNHRNLSLGIEGILGCFLYTLIAFGTHIFFAHNYIHNLIINFLGIIFFLYFFFKDFLIYKKKILKFLLLIILFIILLFLSKNNEDFPYYHLPFMINLIEHKIQFGIGHFNYSYRTPSSLFYLQSLFYLPGVKYYILHASGLIILIFSNLFLLDKYLFNENKINNYIKIFSCFIFVFINLFFISLAKYGTDRAGHIIAFIIFIIYLELINSKNNFLSNVKILVILIIYLISIKSYFLVYLGLFFPLLYFIVKNKKFIDIFNNNIFIFSVFFFLILYFFINFSISGCFITLLKFTCADKLFWTTPIEVIEHYNTWYELWAKSGASPNYRVSNPEEYIKFFNWLPNWINNYFFTKGTDVLSGILSICIFFIIFLKKKKNIKNNSKYYSLYLFVILIFFIWFYKHPDLRYGGYVLIASIFFIPLSFYLSKYKLKNNNFFYLITILIIISLNIRNVVRINDEFKRDDPYIYKNFPFFYINDVKYEKKNIQEDITIYIVDKEMCWATPSPCSPRNINVKKINGYNFFYP